MVVEVPRPSMSRQRSVRPRVRPSSRSIASQASVALAARSLIEPGPQPHLVAEPPASVMAVEVSQIEPAVQARHNRRRYNPCRVDPSQRRGGIHRSLR